MNVFIMRHGEAEAMAQTDAHRELTPEGRSDITQMASSYRDALSQVDVIWASTYVRAQQTAAIMAEHLSKPIITQPFLPPSANPTEVLSALEASRHQTVLVVSHQPLVGVLVDGLAGLEAGRYRMTTSALAYLSTDVYANGCCELRWLHHPTSAQAAC